MKLLAALVLVSFYGTDIIEKWTCVKYDQLSYFTFHSE